MIPDRKSALRFAAPLALLALLAGCAQKKAERPSGPPVVPVTVATASQKTIPLQLTSIGTVEAYSTVAVRAQISGEVTGVHFAEGQDVNKGDLLFTIDARPFDAELQKAVATLAKDQAQLANARAQAGRYAELQKQGVVAREQAEAVVTNAQALEATVNADKAMVDSARVQLQYCKIYAPISGRTGNVSVKAGNIVKANDVAMVTINQVSPIFANFTVPEASLPGIKRYMAQGKLAVEARLANEEPARGQLTFVDNAVDPTTGTIHLKATFANARRLLWPGQFVTTVLTLATERDATVIPSQAVQNGQQGTYVYVVNNNTAESRAVVIERTAAGDSVVKSGIRPGEVVITDGQLRLTPGAKVDIRPGLAPQSQSAGVPAATPAPADRATAVATLPASDSAEPAPAPGRNKQEGQ